MEDMNLIEIFNAAQTITEFPMVDRDPLSFWMQGRVTLMDDAAHPMYPIGANGASQAIIDAQALADIPGQDASPSGLDAYEQLRLPVTTNVVLNNRQGGPEKVLDIADALVIGPDDRIEDLITSEELEEIASTYRNAAGFQKKT